jgi:hypothetical protein
MPVLINAKINVSVQKNTLNNISLLFRKQNYGPIFQKNFVAAQTYL